MLEESVKLTYGELGVAGLAIFGFIIVAIYYFRTKNAEAVTENEQQKGNTEVFKLLITEFGKSNVVWEKVVDALDRINGNITTQNTKQDEHHLFALQAVQRLSEGNDKTHANQTAQGLILNSLDIRFDGFVPALAQKITETQDTLLKAIETRFAAIGQAQQVMIAAQDTVSKNMALVVQDIRTLAVARAMPEPAEKAPSPADVTAGENPEAAKPAEASNALPS